MFSVLLFGTSGIVLDFGRVYSEHGNMQSYTDQAALAAAAELDGRPDSVSRAIDAVFGGLDAEGNDLGAPLTKSATFSSGVDNQFNISHLVFLSDLPNDGGAQSSMAGIKSDIVYVAFADGGSNGNAADASKAKYVIAVAEERSVSNTLISLINSGAETAAASSNIVRTVAAAARRKNYCGEFSNLVMCSRQDDLLHEHPSGSAADLEVGEFMEAFEGARFVHIADNQSGAETHRLYRRHNPMLASVAALQAVCDSDQMPGATYGESIGKTYEYRAICHLAAARQRDHCIGDTIQIVRAEPEVIATALNVAFDRWDFPISEALNWQGTLLEGELALMQPDLLKYTGQIRSEPATIAANISNHGLLGTQTLASRLHYENTTGSGEYDVNIPSCFNNASNYTECGVNQPGLVPYIGTWASGSSDLEEYYQENYPEHYLHVNGGLNLDASINSFFDLYLVERSEWTHAKTDIVYTEAGEPYFDYVTFTWVTPPGDTVTIPAGTSLSVTRADGSLADLTPSPEQATQIGHEDLDDEHANYPLPVNPDDTQYRRKMSVPLVDCSNMSFDPTTGVADVEVLEFVDMYLLQPPRVFCPGGGEMCNNANISSVSVFTEFVEKSDYVKTEYPELVR